MGQILFCLCFLNGAHHNEPRPLSFPLQVGMDKSINNLVTPLSQLQEEIMVKNKTIIETFIRILCACIRAW